MAIVGISGSPIINGNNDRLTKAILEKSGRETKFINLSKLTFSSCRGCAHLCATTAMCGVKDGLHPHLKDIRDAEALVISSSRHHNFMTAWMYSFFSRLWCFLHENNTLKNKPVVFVSVGSGEFAKDEGTFRASLVKEHEFNVLGHIFYKSLVPPCLICGKGHICHNPHGGLWKFLGRDEEALRNFEFTPDKFTRWEDDMEIVDEVKKYGKILSTI